MTSMRLNLPTKALLLTCFLVVALNAPPNAYAQEDKGTLTYGDVQEATINALDGDRWTFEGSAGDVVTLAMQSEEIDSYLEISDPTGDFLVANDDERPGNKNALIRALYLKTDGIYTVTARSLLGDEGDYTLTLTQETPTEPAALTIGSPVIAILEEENSLTGEQWTFEGKRDELITVIMDSSDLDPYLELTDSEGVTIASDDDGGDGFNARISNFRLPADDTYTIKAGAAFRNSGAYVLTLRYSELVEQGALEFGTPVEAELTTPDGDRWTFEGTVGEGVRIFMDSNLLDTRLELFDPDGVLIALDEDGGEFFNARLTWLALPADGTYTIGARDTHNEIGPYTLTLQSFVAVVRGELAYGDTIEDTLLDEDGDRWTFSGTAGDSITISLSSADFDAYLELYDAAGALLITNDDDGEGLDALIRAFSLPTDGTYTIVARSIGRNGLGTYTLIVSR